MLPIISSSPQVSSSFSSSLKPCETSCIISNVGSTSALPQTLSASIQQGARKKVPKQPVVSKIRVPHDQQLKAIKDSDGKTIASIKAGLEKAELNYKAETFTKLEIPPLPLGYLEKLINSPGLSDIKMAIYHEPMNILDPKDISDTRKRLFTKYGETFQTTINTMISRRIEAETNKQWGYREDEHFPMYPKELVPTHLSPIQRINSKEYLNQEQFLLKLDHEEAKQEGFEIVSSKNEYDFFENKKTKEKMKLLSLSALSKYDCQNEPSLITHQAQAIQRCKLITKNVNKVYSAIDGNKINVETTTKTESEEVFVRTIVEPKTNELCSYITFHPEGKKKDITVVTKKTNKKTSSMKMKKQLKGKNGASSVAYSPQYSLVNVKEEPNCEFKVLVVAKGFESTYESQLVYEATRGDRGHPDFSKERSILDPRRWAGVILQGAEALSNTAKQEWFDKSNQNPPPSQSSEVQGNTASSFINAVSSTGACMALGVRPAICFGTGILTSLIEPSYAQQSTNKKLEKKYSSNDKTNEYSFSKEESEKRQNACYSGGPDDVDGDGISDDLELNGYTVVKGRIVPWNETYVGKKRYVSNPYNSRSSGDPYTDLEKALNKMPAGIPKNAQNPLVPCYPDLLMKMEKVYVESMDSYIEGHSTEKTESKSDETTHEHSGSISLSTEMATDRMSLSGSITYGFAHISSKGKEFSNSTGTNYEAITDTSESAQIKMEVKLKNEGTAPAYEARVTGNIYFENNAERRTLSTVETKGTLEAHVIIPGATYPKEGQQGLLLTRQTESIITSGLIVSLDEYNSLINKDCKIIFETIQTDSLFCKLDKRSGALNIYKDQKWGPYLAEILEKKTSIGILSNSKNVEYTVVSAQDEDEDCDEGLDLRILDAIAAAYNAKKTQEGYSITYDKKEYILDEKLFTFQFDPKTQEMVSTYLKSHPNESYFDVPLRKGMEITLGLPAYVNPLNDTQDTALPAQCMNFHEGTDNVTGEKIGKIKHHEAGIVNIKNAELAQNVNYRLSFDVKSNNHTHLHNNNTHLHNEKFKVSLGNTQDRVEKVFDRNQNTHEWHTRTLDFTSSSMPEFDQNNIYIENLKHKDLLIKDVKINTVDINLNFNESSKLKRVIFHDVNQTIGQMIVTTPKKKSIGGFVLKVEGAFFKRIFLQKDFNSDFNSDFNLDLKDHLISMGSSWELYEFNRDEPHATHLIASFEPDEKSTFKCNLQGDEMSFQETTEQGKQTQGNFIVYKPSHSMDKGTYELKNLKSGGGAKIRGTKIKPTTGSDMKDGRIYFKLPKVPNINDRFALIYNDNNVIKQSDQIHMREINGFHLDKQKGQFISSPNDAPQREDLMLILHKASGGYMIKDTKDNSFIVINKDKEIHNVYDLTKLNPENYLFEFVSGSQTYPKDFSIKTKFDIKGEGKFDLKYSQDNKLILESDSVGNYSNQKQCIFQRKA